MDQKKISGIVSALVVFFAAQASAQEQTDLEFVASVVVSEEFIGATMDDMVLQAESLLDPLLSQLGPAKTAGKEVIRNMFRDRVNAQLAELAYANQLESLPQIFTAQEISDIATFMRTPSGRAWAENQPALLKLNTQTAVSSSREASLRVAKNLIADIRENGGPKVFIEKLEAEKK